MALTQVTTEGIKDGTITGSDLATNVDLIDNQKIRFGTGNDLQIYHDGSNSYLKNSTGLLYVRGGGDWLVLQAEDGENSIICKPNGTVELYHDHSKKFETLSTGVLITGSDDGDGGAKGDFKFLQTDGTLKAMFDASASAFEFYDNTKAIFGSGDDLQIYHDGSNSYIDNTTGTLHIRDDSVIHFASTTNEDLAKFTANGAVELYFDNSKIFETGSDQATITGKLTINRTSNDEKLILSGSSGPYIRFQEGTTNKAYIQWSSNGYIILQNDESNNGLRIGTHGAEVLDNTKFTAGDSKDLQIFHNGTNSTIQNLTGDLVLQTVVGADDIMLLANDDIKMFVQGGAEAAIIATGDGAVDLYYDGSKKFETLTDGINVTGTLKVNGSALSTGSTNNLLINGNFAVNQRGGVNTTINTYALDRWRSYGGPLGFTISQQNNISNGSLTSSKYAIRVARNSGNSQTNNTGIAQGVETLSCQGIAGTQMTLSFFARKGADFSSNVLKYIIFFGQGIDQNPVGMTSQTSSSSDATLATTFTKYTKTVTVPANTSQITVAFAFDPIGTAGSNDWFEIAECQLERGSVASTFVHRLHNDELLLCKRYFQIIKGNSDLVMFGSGRASGTSNALVPVQLAVPLRASPTISSTNYSGWGTSGAHTASSTTPSVQSFNDTDNQLNMNFGSLGGALTNARVAVVSCNNGSNLVMDSEL